MRPYIIGTGSFVPPTRVTNEEIMGILRAVKPNGELVPADWLERHLGIETRALDLDLRSVKKASRAQGGLYDGDLAVQAAKLALKDAEVSQEQIDVLVHVSCTPDTNFCGDHWRFIVGELSLTTDVHLVHHNLGCAGLAAGIRSAFDNLLANGNSTTVLLVASNCPSGFMSRESLGHYATNSNPWGWTSPAVFGDGGAAMILRLDGSDSRGLLATRYETHPEESLILYPGGGSINHTRASNVSEHLFLMDAERVGRMYPILMQRNFAMLQKDWPSLIQPIAGYSFDANGIARWYFHQANGKAVLQTADSLGIPRSRVPLNVDRYGNTSAPSTLILLDEDRRAGVVKEGDIVVFMWIGAGNGAMNGYAVFVL